MSLLQLHLLFQLTLLSHVSHFPNHDNRHGHQWYICHLNVSIVNHATIDNVSSSNEYDDEGEIGEVDSLDIYFHNTNKNIEKNDEFSPSMEKPKNADTDNTPPKQKQWNYTREEDIAQCRSFINLSKNSIEATEKNGIILGRCA